MQKGKLILTLSLALLCLGSANAEFYTVTQTIGIPGQDCQIILISIFDDKGTLKKSDDQHMKTDVFIGCDVSQSDTEADEHKKAEQYPMANIVSGGMAEFAKALIHNADGKYERPLNYLLKISQDVDKCNTTQDCKDFFNTMNNAPAYFTPYIIKQDGTITIEEYLDSINNGKNE